MTTTAEQLCSTDIDVDLITAMTPGRGADSVFCLLSTPPRTAILTSRDGETATTPLAAEPDKAVPAGVAAFVALVDSALVHLPSHRPVFELPSHARDVAVAVEPLSGADDRVVVHAAWLVDDGADAPVDADAPTVLPNVAFSTIFAVHVVVLAGTGAATVQGDGPVRVAHVTARSERLAIARNGSQIAWAVMKNDVPEEAERGDVHTCATTPGAQVRALTAVGGRVSQILLSADGGVALFGANLNAKRPITTRMQLWHVSTRDAAAQPRAVLPDMADEQCEDFAFVVASDGFLSDELYVTHVLGVLPQTHLVRVGAAGTRLAEPVAESSGAPVRLASGALALVTESETALPTLLVGAHRHALPQAALFAGMRASHFAFPTSDGERVTAMFFTRAETPKSAPLLVHVVGGPSVTSRSTLRAACAMTRYPYRALLTRGFQIVTPMYRGKLGFGDRFAALCIGNQGVTDLRDIMETIAATKDRELVSVEARLGIFGGSYGGYMTMRAMSSHPCTFVAGVAEYGFVSSKFICAEVGDFTWDEEYHPDEPIDQPNAKSDLWPYALHKIERPILFTHGQDDPICPVSQSKVAYRLLHQKGVPTQLVVYPNEKHGYTHPAHKSDRAKRILHWFEKSFF